MAKIRKYKLSWQASDSDTVTGYKLYWSELSEVGYDSQFIDVGNTTEMEVPDDVAMADGPIMFGVTAVDEDGNESDMTVVEKPYQIIVPKAPTALIMTHSDEFNLLDSRADPEADGDQTSNDDPLSEAIENHEAKKPVRIKYYDDVGYRRFRS